MCSTCAVIHLNSLCKDNWDVAQAEVLKGRLFIISLTHQKIKIQGRSPLWLFFKMTSCGVLLNGFHMVIHRPWIWLSRDNLPLYAAIVPNQDGKGMPVFYMLCTKDNKQGHERIALELVLTYVFALIREIRPTAIVIDKHKTSLNAINKVVEADVHCWIIQSGERIQVARKILLCHFHVMKAWNENLLTRISIHDKQYKKSLF